jgi:dCTP deaminase
MILTGPEIVAAQQRGELRIEPFTLAQLNPNSYNLRLASTLRVYTDPDVEHAVHAGWPLPSTVLDCRADNPTYAFEIPEEGLILYPGKLYLGATVEYTETATYVPMLDGRSSFARLGLSIHQTGGFGDVGFRGHWTIEISCVEPVRIYAGLEICQIRFQSAQGERTLQYDQIPTSKYAHQVGPTPSRLFQETTRRHKHDNREDDRTAAQGGNTPRANGEEGTGEEGTREEGREEVREAGRKG